MFFAETSPILIICLTAVIAMMVATPPPIKKGRRSPPCATKPPITDPIGISPQTIVRRAPWIRP